MTDGPLKKLTPEERTAIIDAVLESDLPNKVHVLAVLIPEPSYD